MWRSFIISRSDQKTTAILKSCREARFAEAPKSKTTWLRHARERGPCLNLVDATRPRPVWPATGELRFMWPFPLLGLFFRPFPSSPSGAWAEICPPPGQFEGRCSSRVLEFRRLRGQVDKSMAPHRLFRCGGILLQFPAAFTKSQKGSPLIAGRCRLPLFCTLLCDNECILTTPTAKQAKEAAHLALRPDQIHLALGTG